MEEVKEFLAVMLLPGHDSKSQLAVALSHTADAIRQVSVMSTSN
jgi:hypothetical protein